MCSTTSTRLESLSNELLLDIFEYVDGYNLYQAFYGLNHRINNILRSATLHILYESSYSNNAVWNSLASFANPSQIRVLSFHNHTPIDRGIVPTDKENLYSVRLHGLKQKSISGIFQLFPTDNQIKCLYINECSRSRDRNNHPLIDFLLLDNGHRFTSLVNLSLSLVPHREIFPEVSVNFPYLRRLSLCHAYWSKDFFEFLQNKAPNVKSLKFNGYRGAIHSMLDFKLKYIKELHIGYPTSYYDLQDVLPVFPSLIRLHVAYSNDRRSRAIDGSHWQQLIEQRLPELKQLTIDYGRGTEEGIARTFYVGDFWSTKKVSIKMIVNKSQSRYRLVKTIYFGRPWKFAYFDGLEF